MAGNIDVVEAGRAVTLVCGGVLGPYLHPRAQRFVARRLATLGVSVLDGPVRLQRGAAPAIAERVES